MGETTATEHLYRLYGADELGKDGYPPEWHQTLKHAVREQAGHRCVRCHHPYRVGEHGTGEWTPCDARCTHIGPARVWSARFERWLPFSEEADIAAVSSKGYRVEAAWRVLTVHHLDKDKANCRWWNLAALCQRCHLTIQGRVLMARVWPWEHTDWFKPYVAGFYAHTYLGEDLTREQVDVRLDELLALERAA